MATSSTVNLKLVEQFITVTGADRDVALNLLEACAGDLNMAVGMHMDNSGAGASNSRGEGDYAAFNNDEDTVRAPIPQKTEILVEDEPNIFVETWKVRRTRQQRSVFDGFRNFQSESYEYDPSVKGKSQSKKRSLEDLYRPPVDITFKGTFQNSRDVGIAQNKWLLVNIQNVQEFSCQLLNRDVWSNAEARNVIKDHFIFWQVYNDSEEGKRFMQFYKFTKWPYVAVIDPFTGEKQIVWSKISDGPVFCELVKDFLSSCPVPDDSLRPSPVKRQKRLPSMVDASEQEQMEAAIMASLVDNKPKRSSPQYVLDSDSEAGNLDDLETFSDSDGVIELSPAASSNGGPRAEIAGSSGASSSRRCIGLPKNRHCVRQKQRLSHTQPSSSSATASSSSSQSSTVANSNIRRLSPSVNSDVQIIGPSDNSDGSVQSGLWDIASSLQLGRGSPLEVNMENSLIDMMGCREAEVCTPEVYTLDDSRSSSQTSLPDREVLREFQAGSRSSSIPPSPGSIQTGSSWTDYWGHPSDPMSRIMIRFPNNTRETVKLPCTSQLQALSEFCSSKGFPTDKYELVTNYPRRRLSLMCDGTTLMDAGLHPQETVFVQDI